ncbi:MAG: hypothetical protein ACJ78Z_10850 [Myxococcales bacterium]
MSLLFAILLAVADGNGTHPRDAAACDGGACEQEERALPATGGGRTPEHTEERVLRMARQDLAKRLGIPEKEVKTGAVQRRTFSDASLGCPKPDTMYAQVETPGYVIELAAGGKSYEYHADAKRVVACE